MPLYDFECCKCGDVKERLVGSTVKDIICEECYHIANRLPSAPSFIKIVGYSEKNGYGSRSPYIPAEYKDHVGALEREEAANPENN